ncbi:hypothetical protein EC396_13000, partial [Lutibacter sp. HS1-25]|uniref:hypothetical protein n=1 Tax=Lutibacter sp. HS1-25 TaxID=2485000 RepID=UPI0010287A12
YQVTVVADPVIDTQPIASQELCQNVTPTILEVTTSGGVGTDYLYQWYATNTNSNTGGTPISGATNAT